jgi:hypothetical protein
MLVERWRLPEFSEVHQILEYKDGCVYKTRSTKCFLKNCDVDALARDYFTTSVSTSLLKGNPTDKVELPIFNTFSCKELK